MATNKKRILLHPEAKSPHVKDFEGKMRRKVIGQDRALSSITSLYQVFRAGLANPSRPLGTMLFLGPTGSGKTRVVEAAAEVLFDDPNAVVKIDCAEFQHSHEIAKLIGSPPGYLGHRETTPMLTQETLDKHQTERDPFTFVLFDEIEKASDSLWQLLLGVLDKATLTLGDNRKVDFSKTMIFMTSNLGAREMSELITGSIGFTPARGPGMAEDTLDQKIYTTALEAARKKFSPEFMNRIDKVVVFRRLKESELRRILEIELDAIQNIINRSEGVKFTFMPTLASIEFLIAEGTDLKYGARHLKRAIERFILNAFANLAMTGQINTGDLIIVDYDGTSKKLCFFREEVTFGKKA